MTDTYDLIVIGTGPAGYVCAIKAAQLGLKVAVVEKRATHGGTCLNVGCIPSKALLFASEMFAEAGHGLGKLGIAVDGVRLDLPAMHRHKAATVKSNVDGVAYLFKKNGIDAYHGAARLIGEGRVEVAGEGGARTLQAKNVVIATGSEAVSLPGVAIDEKRVVTSTGALDLETVPERLVVIGAGVIGLELGSVWRRLGSEVVVVEYLDRILPGMDSEVARQFQRMLEKQGLGFRLGTRVTGVDASGARLEVATASAKGDGEGETLEADVVLVAVGRRAYADGLGLDEIGVRRDNRGVVEVDENFRTSVEGVYAIGDVIRGPMLAHKGEDEGIAVAEILAGQRGHVNYEAIPGVVYTAPEVASVGATEEELKERGVAYKVGKFPFSANGRARSMNMTEGFVKVLADAKTDRVLGVHIIGHSAGDMIHEAAVLIEFGGSSEDLGRTSHAHPTLSEAVREAALATFAKPIHI